MKKGIIYIVGVVMYLVGCIALEANYGTKGVLLGGLCGLGTLIYSSSSDIETK